MMSVDFIKKRIQKILELKKERHFVPGFILGSYGIMMMATLMAYWTFLLLAKIENPFFDRLIPAGALFMPAYVVIITILAGKEIIWCHMMIFRQLDNLTKWIIDRYSIRYYRKHKKDPPILDIMSKVQYKLFSRFTKMTPRGRKKMVVTAISVWVAWVVLGRTDAIEMVLGRVSLFLFQL
ncbi:MAG: hypothetical protein M8319_05650 [Nitrosopumilus sp.]|nr:hypothetical protein [Nitrosopumilus sp.]